MNKNREKEKKKADTDTKKCLPPFLKHAISVDKDFVLAPNF